MQMAFSGRDNDSAWWKKYLDSQPYLRKEKFLTGTSEAESVTKIDKFRSTEMKTRLSNISSFLLHARKQKEPVTVVDRKFFV